jgi:hypothetical protein
MRINSAPDVKCFCNNRHVLCVQLMTWHFVRHPLMYTGLHAKYPLFLSDFNDASPFCIMFRKILVNQISRKSVQWEQSFPYGRTERQVGRKTDRTKLIVANRNFFANAPKNCNKISEQKFRVNTIRKSIYLNRWPRPIIKPSYCRL